MSTQRTYTGRSGQMAVMAELLFRQCNVAIPEVDVGTDVFAFHDEREEVARVQVKTGQGDRYRRGEGHSAQFSIPLKQLERPDKPPLYYALAVRLEGRYVDFLIVGRARLNEYWNGPQRFGTPDKEGNLVLTVQFRERVLCGDVDPTDFRNAWHLLPPLQPLPVVKEGAEQAGGTGQIAVRVEEILGDDLLPPPGPAGPPPGEPPAQP